MISIQIINKLDPIWIDPDSEHELTDQEYIELIHEDIGLFLEGAYFQVIRHLGNPGDWHTISFEWGNPEKTWHQTIVTPAGKPVWIAEQKEESSC